jgi:hypothetical protein
MKGIRMTKPVPLRFRHLLSAGRKSSLLGVPPAGKKSGGGSPSPDKHKMNGPGRRSFAFLDHLAYDLEGLTAGAGQVSTFPLFPVGVKCLPLQFTQGS